MDKEHIKGAAKKVEGQVKETAGKVSGNKKLETEGKLDKAEGQTRKVAGDVKDAFKK
ncbi:CsbD family protein [Hyphomonas sp.]|uniref:CsbD family protein n=1 Tax=Hyphomonas sp. TaxID=87 RepID=UPI00391C5EB7